MLADYIDEAVENAELSQANEDDLLQTPVLSPRTLTESFPDDELEIRVTHLDIDGLEPPKVVTTVFKKADNDEGKKKTEKSPMDVEQDVTSHIRDKPKVTELTIDVFQIDKTGLRLSDEQLAELTDVPMQTSPDTEEKQEHITERVDQSDNEDEGFVSESHADKRPHEPDSTPEPNPEKRCRSISPRNPPDSDNDEGPSAPITTGPYGIKKKLQKQV